VQQDRFVPRRVPFAEIEASSAIAPQRRVRVNHGPIRATEFNEVGLPRMLVGWEGPLPARAAPAVVASGAGSLPLLTVPRKRLTWPVGAD
jgi:hypothetical protein